MSAAMSHVDDAELVVRALDGNQDAVGEMYDRYADSIYSFCRSRLRNDADAADATQDTFVRASTRLSQLREPAKLRAWLYAIARNQVIATGRQSSRLTNDDDMELIVADDAEPDIDLLRVENANQLWAAAGGLAERDQEVLELHLRHGLVGRSLADALGVTESHANVLLSRMRDRVGTSLGSLLVAREGRDECYELDLLLGGWDGRFTLDIRSRVTRHVKACDICETTHTRVLAGGVSFGILPIIPSPDGLRTPTLARMGDALGIRTGDASTVGEGGPIRFADTFVAAPGAPETDWEWMPDGFPGGVAAASRRGAMLLASAAVFIVLVLLGGVTALAFRGDGSVETAATVEVAGVVQTTEVATTASTSTTSSSAPASTVFAEAPPSTGAAADVVSTTELEALGAPSTTVGATTAVPTTLAPTTQAPTTQAPTTQASTTIAPTTEAPTTLTPTTEPPPPTDPPPPPNEPPNFTRAAATPSLVQVKQGARCLGDPATVIAVVSDPDGEVVSVVVTWRPGNGDVETTTLQPAAGAGEGTYTGSIGPWFADGRQSSSVTATDDDGDSTTTRVTVSVSGCPAG